MRANYVLSGIGSGLRRNLTMTVAMILTTAISLTLLGSGLLLFQKVNQMKDYFYVRVEVSIFLKDNITDQQLTDLRQQLDQDPLVKSAAYESKADAYRRFREQFRDSPNILNNVRPTALPASFRVKLKDPRAFDKAAKEYTSAPGVGTVFSPRRILGKLFGIIGAFQTVAVVIAVVVLIAAVLLVGNTIQVAAFNRRRETEIMRLVGASGWYVKLPFVLEAVVAGAIGWIVALGLLVAGKKFFIDGQLSGLFSNQFIPSISYADVLGTSPWLLLVATALTALTAWITLTFYVRV